MISEQKVTRVLVPQQRELLGVRVYYRPTEDYYITNIVYYRATEDYYITNIVYYRAT